MMSFSLVYVKMLVVDFKMILSFLLPTNITLWILTVRKNDQNYKNKNQPIVAVIQKIIS